MKKSFILPISLILISWLNAQEITVNQLGYFTDQLKLATVPAEYDGKFQVVDDNTSLVVYQGELSFAELWSPADQEVRIADFTSFSTPGTYHLEVEDTEATSYSFSIGSDIFRELSRLAMRYYYLSRVSMPLLEEYAGEYARAAGHPDTAVRIHASAASPERPEGSTISTPRGWYDAGDYNKYVVNAGISNYTVFAIAEHYPDYAAGLDLNIPESGNGVPDVIDEGIYDLRWMLSMQDPNDGGVYHKCTHLQFTGFITPAQAASIPRYVVMKTTAATLDMAAVAAQASRILRDYETQYPGLADSCLEAAIYAYEWAQAHPAVYYQQPEDVGTGSYGDNNVTDEFRWASMELYIATLDDNYLDDYNYLGANAGAPGWAGVYSLGLISLLRNGDQLTEAVDIEAVKQKILTYADSYYNTYVSSAYKIPAASFYWGSNGGVANGALMSLQAYHITKNEKYREAAIACLDYLLGRNPTHYSFVTGVGSQTPMYPHDRKSASDGIVQPIPGMLVGGPNPSNTYDCGATAYPSSLPALSYLDNECSYSTNEITINWNAPLAYLACALQAYQSPGAIDAFTGVLDSSLIFVTYDTDLDETSVNPGDFTITVNTGESRSIALAGMDTPNTLVIELDSWIAASDSNIQFSYMPGTLTSLQGIAVDTITELKVLNLVFGSVPEIVYAVSDDVQPLIYLGFSKKMSDPSAFTDNFILNISGTSLPAVSGEIQEADSLVIALQFDTYLTFRDTLLLSYTGSGYTSADGGQLKTFDSLLVINNYPTPAVPDGLALSPGGELLELFFTKPIAGTSVHAEDFNFTRNNDEPLTISNAGLDTEDTQVLWLEFAEPVQVGDTNLLVSYTGDRLLSAQLVKVDPFGPLEVENIVTIPHEIPGHIEAEDFFLNVGYIFESCTDEGGGENLGYADAGDYIDYYVDVAASGVYTITYRLASNVEGSRFRVFMPEENPIDTIAMASTGGWQNWTSLYSLVSLTAGPQLLRIRTDASAFNLNWMLFEEGNTIPVIPPEDLNTQINTNEFRIFPNPLTEGNELTIEFYNEGQHQFLAELYDIYGRKLCMLHKSKTQEGRNQIITQYPDPRPVPGIYFLVIKRGKDVRQFILRIQ